jgi:hypothetical protein
MLGTPLPEESKGRLRRSTVAGGSRLRMLGGRNRLAFGGRLTCRAPPGAGHFNAASGLPPTSAVLTAAERLLQEATLGRQREAERLLREPRWAASMFGRDATIIG